jgi:hypothetical protein
LFALDTTNGNLYQTSSTPMVTQNPNTGSYVANTLAWTAVTVPWGATPPALVSADIASAGTTELWTMSSGKATAYSLSGTKLTAGTVANLVVPGHDWPLTDDQLVTADNAGNGGTAGPPAAASDLLGTDNAVLSSAGATWDDQSGDPYFSGDISFGSGSGYVAPPATTFAQSDTDPTLSLWFNTTSPNGVLASIQAQAVSSGPTTSSGFDPILYVGTDGKLNAEFWNGSAKNPITSSSTVDNGAWHHVVLAATTSGSTTTQTLYLDGKLIASATGTISFGFTPTNLTFGTGYIGGGWPDEANQGNNNNGALLYFKGNIAGITFS